MTSAAYAVRDQRCVPAWSHALWLAAAQRAIEQATLRIDAESALRALVDLLGRPATSPAPLLTRPGWAALMAGTGRRRSWLASKLMARFRTEPEPVEATQDCPECLSKISQQVRRCAFCTAPLAPAA